MTSDSAWLRSGGFFDFDVKVDRLDEVTRELEDPGIWGTPEKAQELGKERARLESTVRNLTELGKGASEGLELLEMIVAEDDADSLRTLEKDTATLEERVGRLEFARMFGNPMDPSPAYVDIQAGAGGTEAQDWAEMLLRMYLRWCERKGFTTELLEVSAGDVAGIKSATFRIEGDYAFGWMRTEIGVHRLVRISPYDSSKRRHTSFASVFVAPEVDDSFEIDINPADLKTDVYRSSGAGGQHVNKTESAVRITHVPSGIVVACQTERSQHANRDRAMKMLKAKLYEAEIARRNIEKDKLEATKSEIGWGHQIRSYVLDDARIKDLRTGVERRDTQTVLDGDLDDYVEASLKQGL